MMINDDKENPGQIETELIEKNCDINDYINDMYDKYINLYNFLFIFELKTINNKIINFSI